MFENGVNSGHKFHSKVFQNHFKLVSFRPKLTVNRSVQELDLNLFFIKK